MTGLYGAVGSANRVPPFGGADLLLGTNPMAIAVPAGEPMSEGWMVGRGATPLPDHDPVRIPGDRRAALYNDRRANGIPLHPNLVKTLEEIAGELQVPKLG